MLLPDTDNDAFKKAVDIINTTRLPVFLTGKAGTGKTTFLKYIKNNTPKNTAVVAPTGVAAINAGGTTIHSFFQLPFGPYLPNGKNNLPANYRLSAERKEVLETLELLIIDEISMVRCDMLDAIDAILKYCRREYRKPFGGVQVLYIGDLFQLPPVNNPGDWQILSSVYKCPHFFGSMIISQQPPCYIELTKIYRQRDNRFLGLLNRVRNNNTNTDDFELLETRLNPEFNPGLLSGFITLTTHNSKADKINTDALQRLEGNLVTFDASIQGVFPETAYPADVILRIKPGAQVMFLKNDTEKIRRYYNGKIGLIKEISTDKIWVECADGENLQLIEVKREIWKNTRYILNQKTHKVEEEELGTFTQFPLRLAWAITIHKSQGLTFEKVIIDAENAFSPGQIYVALSRCTSLEGITLLSRVSRKTLASDNFVVRFIASLQQKNIDDNIIPESSFIYQHEIITELFSFHHADTYRQKIGNLIKGSESSFGKTTNDWLMCLENSFSNLVQHAQKFGSILNKEFAQNNHYISETNFGERLKKAANWFIQEINHLILLIEKTTASTDNRQLSKELNEVVRSLFNFFVYRKHLLDGCIDGFNLSKFLSHKAAFVEKTFLINTYSGHTQQPPNTENAALLDLLKLKRNELAILKNLPVFLICKTQSLEDMARYLPRTIDQLGMIKGLGPVKLKNYGTDFIEIINSYCEKHQIAAYEITTPDIVVKKQQKKALKTDTRLESYKLLNTGLSIPEISIKRNLAQSTIENHLCYFVENGSLSLDILIPKEKQDKILLGINSSDNQSLIYLKELLPFASFSEIKWVLASKRKIIRVDN